MGVTNFPNGVNIGNDASGTADWQLGGTSVNVTAAELNAIAAAGGLDAAELDFLDGATAGTGVASKAVVLGAAKDIDILDFAGTGGTAFKVAGTAVTLTAAEFNLVDGLTAGTATASKAVVLGAAKDIDTIDFASAGGFKIAGVALTSSMAELNNLDGVLGNVLAHDAAAFQIVASGSTAITGEGTVATGLAGGDVGQIVASIANAGTIAATADPAVVYARPTGSAGSVIFECYDYAGALASNAGTVHWIAIGTAA